MKRIMDQLNNIYNMITTIPDQNIPAWGVDRRGDVGAVSGQVESDVLRLTDTDIIESLSMWKNPDFLGSIFMQQAGRLGFTIEEKQKILGNVSREDIVKIVELIPHHEGYAPVDSLRLGALVNKKLPPGVDSYEQLISAYFHSPGIIEIYPSRTDNVVHVYSVLNHEINHLLMATLYISRNQRAGISIEKTIRSMVSPVFDQITETLAWLDGGQSPMNIGFMDAHSIARYVGWQKDGRYDRMDSYQMAKLRAYRIHVLQMRIYNLPDTNTAKYQKWCQMIREILLLGINQEEYLALIDQYLDGVKGDYQKARDQFCKH